ncbi:MAG: hypothetical protein IPP94_12680 [Ignavibacteria bacterium]|nr:hypothetical protein [Ignavibacteria bacterium]
MKRFALSFLLLAVLAGCGPSIDPALQSRVATYFGKAGGQTYASSSQFMKPMPYAVGQYVVHGTVYDGKRSVSKTSIVGEEQGGWVIETYSLSESNESWTQMLVKGLEKAGTDGNVDDIDIVWVKTKMKDENVQTVEGPVLAITRGFYRDMLGGFKVKIGTPSAGGSVAVPAGTFNGTQKTGTEAAFFGRTYKSDVWFHSEVPINGLVKSVSKDDGITTELIEFGRSGAKRTF